MKRNLGSAQPRPTTNPCSCRCRPKTPMATVNPPTRVLSRVRVLLPVPSARARVRASPGSSRHARAHTPTRHPARTRVQSPPTLAMANPIPTTISHPSDEVIPDDIEESELSIRPSAQYGDRLDCDSFQLRNHFHRTARPGVATAPEPLPHRKARHRRSH